MAVIWHHTAGGTAAPWLPGADRGFLGVDLFFVISGFLIVTLLLRERSVAGTISLRNFYARRALRIFPIYYMTLAALSAYFLLSNSPGQGAAFLAELPYHATYTSNFIAATSILAISWSLSTEEQFYVVWPPVEKYLGMLVLPMLGLVLICNQLINFRVADPLLIRYFGVAHGDLSVLQATFTPICLGVALAHLLHSERGRASMAHVLGAPSASSVFLLVFLVLANLPASDISGWQRLALQLCMAALVGSCVFREDNSLHRLLTWPPVKAIGAVSYGMYLYHVIVLYFVGTTLMRMGIASPWIRFILCAALTFAVAALSYRMLEQRLLDLKRHFR